MKQYVVCIDGTWNLPGQSDTDPLSRKKYSTETNVTRVFRGLTGVSPDPRTSYGQTGDLWTANGEARSGEAIYFTGVGTEPGTKFSEGITGWGTDQRIMDAYKFLAATCRAGDRIFGFGFSRGAYAIRSLAGLIKYAGLPGDISPHSEDVEELYRRYRSCNSVSETDKLDHRLREVHFLGLWDTVSSLAGSKIDNNISSSNVLKVAHALALDEQRKDFMPEYWMPQNGSPNSNLVKEVWFSGAHSNVGGGYVDDNLSNIAFFWVMKQAQSEGLNINLPSMPWWVREDAGGILRYENNRFPWNYEKLFMFTNQTAVRKITKGQRIHESVIDRIRDQTLQPPYTPKATGELISHDLIPQFWKLIDDPQWKEEWIEPWGYEEQTEEEVAFENQAQTVMQIPKELVPKVQELITQYQSGSYRG